ncbi:MAG: carbohydrate porin [Methylobacteriaceae bacterium]|nr:carbohydrate porin [Rhodoblastus sp.]MCC0005595.1 carbohydrate porin [Methylobacteriaceae bacterium]
MRKPTFLRACAALVAAGAICLPDVGRAADTGAAPKMEAAAPAPQAPKPLIAPDGIPSPSIATSLPPAVGGLFGLRKALADLGFQIGLTYIGEGLANLSGGATRTGAIYEGRLEMTLDGQLDKITGISGLTMHVNAFQIHGRGVSTFNIGNLMPISNIEATHATRLFEAWLQQEFLAGAASVRFGQLAADQEFITTSWGGLFINGTFGWPTITAANLPSGGPAYPLATPGVRVKIEPTGNLALLAAVFNGDPAGPATPFNNPNPQARNNNGVKFRLRDRPFVIAEAQGKYEIAGLAGMAKLGGWTHFGRFADQRFGVDGLSLADPAGVGVAINRRGNRGIYGVLDQQIYKLPSGEADKGVGVFLRASVSPSDRNLVGFYMDGGVNFTGVIPGRPDDSFGVAVGYARISDGARGLDFDTNFFNGVPGPVRSSETTLEATYLYKVVDGWTLQPNFQYVIRPAGGVPDPRDPFGLRRVGNAAVAGLRTTIKY